MQHARLVRFRPLAPASVLAVTAAFALASCGTVPAPPAEAAATQAGRLPSSTASTSSAMDERRFWSIIASTRASRSASGRVELLHGQLRALPPAQIAEFDRQLTKAVDTIAEPRHLGAAEIMMGFTSRDAFTQFRAWVVAQGEDVHADFRDDPDSIVDAGLAREGELVSGGLVAFAPDRAYREATGRNLVDDFPTLPSPEELGSSQTGPSYAELAEELPRLAATYLPHPVPEGNAFDDGPRGITRRS